MKYYVGYAFQREPGNMAGFACSVIEKENLDHGVSEDDLIEITNYLKNGTTKYSCVVILSLIPLCENDNRIVEGDTE
jgi:hypothetical protein